ncbi:hypothetical protein HY634_03230 [Candidatus Uhrbacteria bacterium]|nr:hypothetical protein [Candidatus Uhrbacteria bacterium]
MATPSDLVAHYSAKAFQTRVSALTAVGAILGAALKIGPDPVESAVLGVLLILVVASLGALNERYTHSYRCACRAATTMFDGPAAGEVVAQWRRFRETNEAPYRGSWWNRFLLNWATYLPGLFVGSYITVRSREAGALRWCGPVLALACLAWWGIQLAHRPRRDAKQTATERWRVTPGGVLGILFGAFVSLLGSAAFGPEVNAFFRGPESVEFRLSGSRETTYVDAHDADGAPRWAKRLPFPVGDGASVFADIDGQPGDELVLGVSEHPDSGGLVMELDPKTFKLRSRMNIRDPRIVSANIADPREAALPFAVHIVRKAELFDPPRTYMIAVGYHPVRYLSRLIAIDPLEAREAWKSHKPPTPKIDFWYR